jgi:hypothetical protein
MKCKALLFFSIVVLLVSSCKNTEVHNLYTELGDKIEQGVDLSTSINYEIITDKELIRGINHPETELENPVLINILVKTVNHGETNAESLEISYNEPKPYLHNNGTSSGGIDHGYLKKNEELEYHFTYTFKDTADLNTFIAKSYISIKWIENKVNKELVVNLPSKPI